MLREDAWNILNEYTKSESLLKHALAVEAAMKAYAQKYGGDEERWGVAGLLHDFDYEMYPTVEQHAMEGARILKEKDFPEDIVRAILSHSDYTGVTRESAMEKALYAVDELTGLIAAVALVRPSKSVSDVDLRSVKRKWRDKAFARGVSREDIERGAEELGIDLDQHIGDVIKAMQDAAPSIGL
ncbi:MAG: HDIG domain-containing protein [Dehalococcoidia bacterium]|nr:HDIG domain-containing protein [Dehalococcoidia bacterium]